MRGIDERKYTQNRSGGFMKIRKSLPNYGSRALFSIVGGTVLINPVFAQEPAADVVPEVIVTGIRASLETAQASRTSAS